MSDTPNFSELGRAAMLLLSQLSGEGRGPSTAKAAAESLKLGAALLKYQGLAQEVAKLGSSATAPQARDAAARVGQELARAFGSAVAPLAQDAGDAAAGCACDTGACRGCTQRFHDFMGPCPCSAEARVEAGVEAGAQALLRGAWPLGEDAARSAARVAIAAYLRETRGE